jgi:hypothetical protein
MFGELVNVHFYKKNSRGILEITDERELPFPYESLPSSGDTEISWRIAKACARGGPKGLNGYLVNCRCYKIHVRQFAFAKPIH